MLISTLVQIPMLMISIVVVPAPRVDCLLDRIDPLQEAVALVDFTSRVNRYVELRRELEAGLPARTFTSDFEQGQRAATTLAAALRRARAIERPGNIFTPQVAALFRQRIASAVRDVQCDVASALDEAEEAGLHASVLSVNDSMPWGLANLTWPFMLWKLPSLPEDLEYRVVGRDIVLLDVRANFVVDILEEAVPWYALESDGESDPPFPAPQETPCVAHPELAMCWS